MGRFGSLADLQASLLADDPDTPIRILGVNALGAEDGNVWISSLQKDLPWLQDTVEQGAWASWQPEYRDLVILDRDNRKAAVFNLTEHDLDDPAEVEALRTLLLGLR